MRGVMAGGSPSRSGPTARPVAQQPYVEVGDQHMGVNLLASVRYGCTAAAAVRPPLLTSPGSTSPGADGAAGVPAVASMPATS
jgi:hypothetical protein